MSHFNEHALEMAIMELLEQQGYEYKNGETIHKEPQFRSIIPCEVLLYIEVTFLGFIH